MNFLRRESPIDIQATRNLMRQQAIREDGGALSEHLYMWMERLGRQAPENYLKEGGIQAIDTGRDIKLFEPKKHAQLYKN